jgi:hypothetical protein
MFDKLNMVRYRIQKNILLTILVSLIVVDSLVGGTSAKSVVATRAFSPPHIDGVLNSEEWSTASEVAGFEQYDPVEGAEATESTSVKVLYDDNALYIGVMCYDSEPTAIVRQLTRRDRTAQSDRFSVIIDSYHDHSTAFLFCGTVSGVQTDGILSQDGLVYDVQWDAVWNFDAAVVKDGWSAEFKIPFSTLRFARQDSEYIWGVNFRRFIARKKETDEWVLVRRQDAPPGTISSVSRMGHLSGVTNIHPSVHLEIFPYTVSKVNYLSQPDPFSLRKELKGNLGLDLKYGVTNNFTFDMAINPDFGQVEVDQAVLNLTVFETFYPEKRPFFLEGSQFFSFGNTFDNQKLLLFYSRRIGKKPSVPGPNPDYAFVETPQATKILGAGKFTGKTDNGLTLGVLTTVTDREYGIEEKNDLSGNSRSVLFEPRASYNAIRIKHDIFDGSSIGFMVTGAFKDQESPMLNGGVDWRLRFKNGMYAVDGYFAGSQAVSPLAFPNTGRVAGTAGRIGLGKLQGEHWLALTYYDFSARNFWINDLGYYGQPTEHGGYTQITYKEDQADAALRRYSFSLQTDYRWNWDGVNTVNQVEFAPESEFKNFWILKLNYIRDLPAHDDANRGIIGLYHRPPGNRISASLQTDSRKSAVFVLSMGYQNSTKGLSSFVSSAQVTLRPNTWMEFSPAFGWGRTRNEESWVRSPQTGYPIFTDDGFNLFGDRDIDQYDFSLRGTITFTRHVSVQFFTQVFLAKGEYTNYKKLVAREELPPYDYQNSPRYSNPDFNEKILNANLAFRWEYLPGSTFYLVWTQQRCGDNGLYNKSLSDNIFDTFKLQMDNVILAKLSYWWSL